MIKVHLSKLMGIHKMRIADVAELTGIHRNTISKLYNEQTNRIDFDTLSRLCKLFQIQVGELIEYIPDEGN